MLVVIYFGYTNVSSDQGKYQQWEPAADVLTRERVLCQIWPKELGAADEYCDQ